MTSSGLIALIASTAALAIGCTSSMSEVERVGALPIVRLQGHGPDESLSKSKPDALAGSVHVVNVWASWCEPCRREMPSLEALSRSWDRSAVRVIGINVDDDRNLALEYLRARPSSFDHYWDPGMKWVARSWGLVGVPATLIIGRDGRVIERIVGDRDWSSGPMRRLISSAVRRQASSN